METIKENLQWDFYVCINELMAMIMMMMKTRSVVQT